MDFSLTEDQICFKKLAVEFAKESLNDGFSARERNGEFNFEGWNKCAQFGLHGLPMPEQYGGLARESRRASWSWRGWGMHARTAACCLRSTPQSGRVSVRS